LNLDDTTFHYCNEQIPSIWPNTKEPVKSIRTFKSWQIDWAVQDRQNATANFVEYVKKNNMKVLIGTQVSCNKTDDAREWNGTMNIMHLLGPDHIMGLAVGNELDLLHSKDHVTKECIRDMWAGGYAWRTAQERIATMDKWGKVWSEIPVTCVFSGAALTAVMTPFQEDGNALVTSYLRNASAAFGARWVMSFNIYTFWNPFYMLDFPYFTNKCTKAIKGGTTWNGKGSDIMTSFKTLRTKLHQLTGNWDDKLWIGEIGWSSPNPTTPPSTAAKKCKDFASLQTYRKFYENYLSYDMSIPDDFVGPDHIFYFTIRDAAQFGFAEHFGLMAGGPDPEKQCEYKECKLHEVHFKDSVAASANEAELVV